jgi:ankyrin repeat protein
MNRSLHILFAICITCSPIMANADGLRLAGKSAKDAFNDDGVVNLLKAAINGNVTETKGLIAEGVNINAKGEGGITPLLWVELNQDLNAMRLLLDLGADPNGFVLPQVGKPGLGPPAWLAAAAGQENILQLLLDHGADPNLEIADKSPLMMAIGSSHLDCAELLLKYGADINYSAGHNSMTAFDMGMVVLQYDIVLWVLNHGYTYDLKMARRHIVRENRATRPGQEAMKLQALEIIDKKLATQKQ